MFRPQRAAGIEQAAREDGLLAFECGVRGDLSDHLLYEDIWSEVADQNRSRKETWLAATARQLHLLLHDIQPGDLIAIPWPDSKEISIVQARPEVTTDEMGRPARCVEPVGAPIPRDAFLPDLRHSLGSNLIVCEIARNDALARIEALLRTGSDPGGADSPDLPDNDAALEAALRRRVLTRIERVFAGHAMAELVAAVLAADGYRCQVSPPGPDGGVDILAARGVASLADGMVVQVKSGDIVADLATYNQLKGAMDSVGAPTGLLVSWGGVTRQLRAQAGSDRFRVAIWSGEDLLNRVLEVYETLPFALRDRLGLRQIWI